MADFSFPVKPGDVLEFECEGVPVRAEVFSVNFYKTGFCEYTKSCYIDIEDVYTEKCRKCECDGKTKCKFYSAEKLCTLHSRTSDGIDEIKESEIGTKYKKVKTSWDWHKKEDK